jgi:copper chaperone
MIRRQFLAGAAAAAIGTANPIEKTSVIYHIKGFTCVPCAVGLETILRQRRGVLRVQASYPKASACIEFEPSLVTEKALKQYIAEMGFSVQND